MLQKISWTFSANVISAAVKWLLLVAIAQILTPIDVGDYALALAIASPITLFANMKLRSLYVTSKEDDFRSFATVRNIVFACSLVILIGLSFFYDAWLIVLLVGISKLLDCTSDLLYAVPHKAQEMKKIALLILYKQLGIIVLFTATLFATNSLRWSLVAMVVFQLIYVLIERKNCLHSVQTQPFSSKRVRLILLMGIPLGVTQLIVSFNSFLPRYGLAYFATAEEVGYFSAVSYVTVVVNIVMGAVAQNYIHTLKEQFSKGNTSRLRKILYVDLFKIALVLSVSLLIGVTVFGKLFLTLAYGESYAAYNTLLILLIGCIFFNCLNWNIDTAYMAFGFVKSQLPLTLFATILSIPLTLLLISNYSLWGAGIAMITNSFILYACKDIFLRRMFRKEQRTEKAVQTKVIK